uniref:Light-independent protochlorophyllide reductase subunit B n=1 Tax=Stephanosphaera pluvialis TaxID=51712 RepID=A0A0S2IDI2_9CHLO|nr:ChlB subunit of protochlorophyllide reductase [Stephanosphaera pluvialis]
MKLAYWMYAGPAHIGTLRVASSFKNVHAIMHAPLGDDYFNVMRSMLERERDFTPVTASIVDRHVLARGSQEKVVQNITRKDLEERPDLILLTPTCTSSILQEDLQNFVNRSKNESDCDVILADVNHYRVNELQAADRTLEQIVRFYVEKALKDGSLNSRGYRPTSTTRSPLAKGLAKDKDCGAIPKLKVDKTKKPSANIIGIFTLGFHNQHDCKELTRILNDLGIDVNLILPEGSTVSSLKNLPKAWFNIVPYREVGLMTATYLEKTFNMPYTSITPMGLVDTAAFIKEIFTMCSKLVSQEFEAGRAETLAGNNFITESIIFNKKDVENYIDKQTHFISQAAWFSRSIDCQNLTGKKVVVFGDATHAASITKILVREMGIHVICSGTYCKHDADWFREQVCGYCDQILITDDHSQIGEIIAKLEPAAIFGTQMERHVGKRLDIPCGVISAPVHIQNFPLGFKPFLGYEGTNNISDLIYNSFNLGMEDHLLEIFNGHDNKPISLPSSKPLQGIYPETQIKARNSSEPQQQNTCEWTKEALLELNKVPGFVRSKVKRNTEKYACSKHFTNITVEVMYAAKEAAASLT